MKKIIICLFICFINISICYAEILPPLPIDTSEVGKMPTNPDGVNYLSVALPKIIIAVLIITLFIVYKTIKSYKSR